MTNLHTTDPTSKPAPTLARRPAATVRRIAVETLASDGRRCAVFATFAAMGAEVHSSVSEARELVDDLIAAGAELGDPPRPAPVPRSFDEVQARIRANANIPPGQTDEIIELARTEFPVNPDPGAEDARRLARWELETATHARVRRLVVQGTDPRPFLRSVDEKSAGLDPDGIRALATEVREGGAR